MKGAAGSRSFTASPEVLFQNASNTTDSFARGAAATFLRMDTNGTALEWDTLDVVGDNGGAGATATSAGLRILSENQNQILTVAANNSVTIGFPDDVTIDGDLTVTGNGLTFGNGATIVNTSADLLTITEATTALSGDLQVNGNDIKSSGGQSAITLSGDDVTINGDLIVSGAQTIIHTETISLDDNAIVLNGNASGTASQDAGLVVHRGSDTNTAIFWDESEATGPGGGRWAVGDATETGDAGASTFAAPRGYLATITSQAGSPGNGHNQDGFGSFWIDTSDSQVYIRMS